MSGWGEFAVVTGSATAALLGLLFVAVSIQIKTIARSPELRNRSAQTMALLLTGLLGSVLLVVPNQSRWELGAELVALGVAAIVASLVLGRRAGRQSALGQILDRANPGSITCASLIIGGVLLVLGHDHGLYLLVPALVAVLAGGVVNAWLILIRLGE